MVYTLCKFYSLYMIIDKIDFISGTQSYFLDYYQLWYAKTVNRPISKNGSSHNIILQYWSPSTWIIGITAVIWKNKIFIFIQNKGVYIAWKGKRFILYFRKIVKVNMSVYEVFRFKCLHKPEKGFNPLMALVWFIMDSFGGRMS